MNENEGYYFYYVENILDNIIKRMKHVLTSKQRKFIQCVIPYELYERYNHHMQGRPKFLTKICSREGYNEEERMVLLELRKDYINQYFKKI